MSRGNDLEPILRKRFSAWWGIENTDDPFDPALCEMESHPFIGASLDGLSKDKSTLVEIKYVGKKVLDKGEVPLHYFIQMQHQFLASGAQQGYCVMGNDPSGMDMRIIPVPRNQGFIDTHLVACTAFWTAIQTNAAPESNEAVVEDAVALSLADDYAKLKTTIDELTAQLEETKEGLLKYALKDKTKIAGLNIMKILTKGSVDYKKIPELKNVDLDQYRAEPRVSYRITLDSSL